MMSMDSATGLRELDIALRIMRKDESFWKTGRGAERES